MRRTVRVISSGSGRRHRGDPDQDDPPAVVDDVDRGVDRLRATQRLEGDVDAAPAGHRAHLLHNVGAPSVDDVGRSHPLGQAELLLGDVDRDDPRSTERGRELDQVRPDPSDRDDRHGLTRLDRATLGTAPSAVNALHPSTAAWANEVPSGIGNTAVAGTTHRSASPPIEYIHTGSRRAG